ncbi:hypothetical protein P154DRAFT_568906 [Amniculicola lignicola CBS 123094]|uniref:Uncharacterized protein n=1 Tax=Amniculicola lignicola CBS 123094 TaxID=1392246 RepID=A0A6A5X532_9PLEO|nr:hypothetical protein P154DRAFT_568906 [Amniculicola lignicola CBS 123094]
MARSQHTTQDPPPLREQRFFEETCCGCPKRRPSADYGPLRCTSVVRVNVVSLDHTVFDNASPGRMAAQGELPSPRLAYPLHRRTNTSSNRAGRGYLLPRVCIDNAKCDIHWPCSAPSAHHLHGDLSHTPDVSDLDLNSHIFDPVETPLPSAI